MRHLFTSAESGLTISARRWALHTGRITRIQRDVYGEGPEPPSQLDRERASVLGAGDVARGALAGVLHRLDSVELDGRPRRRSRLAQEHVVIVAGLPCADGLQTLIDLAATLDDDTWEQALESTLRKKLTTIDALRTIPWRVPGAARIDRVLDRRGDVVPTDSLLETLTIQLARTIPGLGPPVRQQIVLTPDGDFVARVDLCWPELGLFVELDGQQHRGQPVYDAARQTAVVAATGWLCARFTWHEIVHTPRTSARRLAAVVAQARRRTGQAISVR